MSLNWQHTLGMTQTYLRNRLVGEHCDRGLIEAWRLFYRTHQPIIARLITDSGLNRDRTEACTREIWIAILDEFPRSNFPLSHDAFLCWLSQLIRAKAASMGSARRRSDGKVGRIAVNRAAANNEGNEGNEGNDGTAAAWSPSESDQRNATLFRMRVVDECSVGDVAQALGLTSHEVNRRHHQMLGEIVRILISLDASV